MTTGKDRKIRNHPNMYFFTCFESVAFYVWAVLMLYPGGQISHFCERYILFCFPTLLNTLASCRCSSNFKSLICEPIIAWRRHQMETVSALLALCERKAQVNSRFHSHRTSYTDFDVFFDVSLNKWLNKQSRRWRFEAPGCLLWRHCNAEWWRGHCSQVEATKPHQ